MGSTCAAQEEHKSTDFDRATGAFPEELKDTNDAATIDIFSDHP